MQSAYSACQSRAALVPRVLRRSSSSSPLPRGLAATFPSARWMCASSVRSRLLSNMAPPLLGGRIASRIEHEVERGAAVLDLGLAHLLGIHRTDDIRARKREPAIAIRGHQPLLEVIER